MCAKGHFLQWHNHIHFPLLYLEKKKQLFLVILLLEIILVSTYLHFVSKFKL